MFTGFHHNFQLVSVSTQPTSQLGAGHDVRMRIPGGTERSEPNRQTADSDQFQLARMRRHVDGVRQKQICEF